MSLMSGKKAIEAKYPKVSFEIDGKTYTCREEMAKRVLIEGPPTKIDTSKLKIGDKIEDETFSYAYDTATGKYGWSIHCHEKTRPLIDVQMPDELFGKPIHNGIFCFHECKNLISVSHLPNQIGENVWGMFDDSGLRHLPPEWANDVIANAVSIQKACGFAYVLEGKEQIHQELRATGENGLGLYCRENEILQKLYQVHDEATQFISSILGDNPPYTKAERVTVQTGLSVIRALGQDGQWYTPNPARGYNTNDEAIMMRYEQFAETLDKKGRAKIEPATLEQLCDAIREYNRAKIDKLENALDDAVFERNTIEKGERREANKAQEGYYEKPLPQNIGEEDLSL